MYSSMLGKLRNEGEGEANINQINKIDKYQQAHQAPISWPHYPQLQRF